MTKEDAIAILKRKSTIPDDDYCWDEIEEAFKMAIKALEQERSRSAEITQYRYDCEKLMEENERLKKALEQEQRPMEKFESAKDHIYKLAGDYKCWDNRLTWDEALELCHILEQEPCEDTISREKAKQFLYERIDRLNDNELYDIFSKIIDDMYNELSSVILQPKTGHWVRSEEMSIMWDIWTCSECGCGGDKHFKYCAYCGAKMIEQQKNEGKE